MKLVLTGIYEDLIDKLKTLNGSSLLYLIETKCNRIKIGMSNKISERLATHDSNNWLYAERHLKHIAVFDPENIDVNKAEVGFINLLSNRFVRIGNEWFQAQFNAAFQMLINNDTSPETLYKQNAHLNDRIEQLNVGIKHPKRNKIKNISC